METPSLEVLERRERMMRRIDPPKSVVIPEPQMWNATHALTAVGEEGEVIGVGSAFVVAFARQDLSQKRCYVVTALHNIHGTIAKKGVAVTLDVRRLPERRDLEFEWPIAPVTIPIERWHQGESDVAITQLPLDDLPDDVYIETVDRADFLDKKPMSLSTAFPVDLYGRWGVRNERGNVVLRRGILASHERPLVTIDVTPGTTTRERVYLVDANVSKGMSGGLAVANLGGGTMQQGVLGLIHGTQRLFEDDLRDAPITEEHRVVRERLLREMEIINGRIVYVVPYLVVGKALDDYDSKMTERAGSA